LLAVISTTKQVMFIGCADFLHLSLPYAAQCGDNSSNKSVRKSG
jgi:hypothetical protein